MADDIKVTEIAGELRKAARMYETFKRAAEIADVITKAEQIERSVKASIDSLEEERDKLKEDIKKLNGTIKNKKDVIDKLTAGSDDVIASTKISAQDIINKAKASAEAIVQKAMNEATAIQTDIDKLKQEKVEARKERDSAILEMQTIHEQRDSAKEKFLKALG